LAEPLIGGKPPVLDFAARMAAEGLMRPAATAVPPSEQPRISFATAGSGPLLLTFEVYEDMKSLILLDPVHEVDEVRGWPAPPKEA
jgi:hypothetical protein